MADRDQPALERHDMRDAAQAPAGQRALKTDCQAEFPYMAAGLRALEEYRAEQRAADSAHRDPARPAPKEDGGASPNGEQRATALTEDDRQRVRAERRVPRYGAAFAPRDEQHDGGKGPEVVRAAEWPRWPGLPGQLYQGDPTASHAGPQEDGPNSACAPLGEEPQNQEPADEQEAPGVSVAGAAEAGDAGSGGES